MVRETKKELEKKIEKERDIISEQLKQKTLNAYDIGRHVFDTVEADVKQEKESDKRSCFMKACERYRSTDNVLIRTAIGKKWAAKDNKKKEIYGYDYDHDDSLMSSIVMRDIILRDGTIKCYHGYEYIISCEEGGKCITYRGDTMNSWSTTLDEYLRRFGGGDDGYFPSLEINKKGKNKGKWRITEEDPARDWVDFLSIPANYKKALPDYITDFMNVVYTIGNFIPLPCGCNGPRGNGPTKDYWDLTLYQIYQWYRNNDMLHRDSKKLPLHNNADLVALFGSEKPNFSNWLISFGSWDNFVNKTYMQPFVKGGGTKFSYESKAEEKAKEGYGEPKGLWKEHFEQWKKHLEDSNYSVYPPTEEEFRSFFTNATACIKDRGKLMMIALEEKMAEQKNSREDA